MHVANRWLQHWRENQPLWQDSCRSTAMESGPPAALPGNQNNGPSGDVMMLSADAVLIFTLQSGVSGRLTAGRVERGGELAINIDDQYDGMQPYFSGAQFRSWCVVDPKGGPIPSWSSMLPKDRSRLLPDD